ncbi:hypothetical protein J4E86_008726 [Alternaria arbusti]|uniref:uncharacterized protein n=1 Tax=Alternaria arbusti TaxID=232088 RepID=UPI00221F9576|nr:uncharacterized protein J4E86_008726 [Alternaria arbusti]KAI4947102.1 hypothetical protein J4E86_008726 [Alternaria arbusti]
MAPYPTPPKATFTLDARLDWKLEPRSTDNESPLSKSPAEERAAASMFIGICLAVTFVLAAPIVWVWLADRIRRRKLDPFRKLRDLERERKRSGIDPPPYAKAPPKDSIWARQEKYATKKPPRAITADQILGIDKRSYLERIVPQSEGSSQLLTVAPAHFGWARQAATSSVDEQYISPWDAEHTPNPVIFPWLQKKRPFQNDINSESSERLQVMAMSNTSSPLLVSPAGPSSYAQADNPFLDSPTEYTSSPPDSEQSYEPSETALRDRPASNQLSDQAPNFDGSSSLYRCDTCQTTYHSQGQLK